MLIHFQAAATISTFAFRFLSGLKFAQKQIGESQAWKIRLCKGPMYEFGRFFSMTIIQVLRNFDDIWRSSEGQ